MSPTFSLLWCTPHRHLAEEAALKFRMQVITLSIDGQPFSYSIGPNSLLDFTNLFPHNTPT